MRSAQPRVGEDSGGDATDNGHMPDPQTPTLRWIEELVTGDHKEEDAGRRFADLFRDIDTGEDGSGDS